MSKITRFIAGLFFLLVVLAGFIFTSNNSVMVPLWIGIELSPQSLAVWVLLAFAWGGVLGLLLGYGLFRRIKAQFKINQLEAQLKKNQSNNIGLASKTSKRLGKGKGR
jgi:lipopolysaccharide assembly protein A